MGKREVIQEVVAEAAEGERAAASTLGLAYSIRSKRGGISAILVKQAEADHSRAVSLHATAKRVAATEIAQLDEEAE